MSTPPPRSAPPISSAPTRCAAAATRTTVEAEEDADAEEAAGAIELGEKRYVEMSAAEQFVLTLSERGYGKRSSSYEYRITGRGGKGIVAMAIWEGKKGRKRSRRRSAGWSARSRSRRATRSCWSPTPGKLIRTPVAGIRIAGRSTQGVIVLNTADDEHVVSVERLSEEEDE